MQITAVDQEHNLFCVESPVPPALAHKVLATDWLNKPYKQQPMQHHMLRKLIDNNYLPWIQEWDAYLNSIWSSIGAALGCNIYPYTGTAFWVDLPGFVCDMHTDGELSGAMQLIWRGTGTTFFWHNSTATERYRVPVGPNTGYIINNMPDARGYRRLLWHAMLDPVLKNNFRVTSYTWIQPL
jgi:hypothetical protein